MRAHFVFSEIWIGLRRNLTMTIAVIVTVAIAMALLGTGLLIRQQVNSMRDYWSDKIEVSVFLCHQRSTSTHCKEANGPATQQQKDQLYSDLKNLPQVKQVYYESQEKAWERFKDRFENSPAFLQVVTKEDMPDSFRIKLKNAKDYKAVVDLAQSRPGVDSVLNEEQVLKKFFDLLNGLRNAALIVAVIQTIAAALLIGNTIRLAAYNRRKETGIMRLVGASNFYIQLPFLLEGVIAGLIGGAIAAFMLVLAKVWLFDSLQRWFTFSITLGWGAVSSVILLVIVAGVLLCGIASFFTLRRYLRV